MIGSARPVPEKKSHFKPCQGGTAPVAPPLETLFQSRPTPFFFPPPLDSRAGLGQQNSTHTAHTTTTSCTLSTHFRIPVLEPVFPLFLFSHPPTNNNNNNSTFVHLYISIHSCQQPRTLRYRFSSPSFFRITVPNHLLIYSR